MRRMVSSIFCFIFNSCQSPSLYGVTNQYLEVADNTPGADSCYKVPNCDTSSNYRNIDGSCNNLENPIWGSSETTYMRLLPAEYHDGLQEIRKGRDGSDLPNVRVLSSALLPDIYVPDKSNNLALMQWGQVLTHDAASTGFPVILDCCPNGQFANPPNEKCYNIEVAANDPYYSQYNVTCMTYTRIDNTATSQNCPLKPQQQFSYATQWLDLSLLYGSDEASAKSIREFKGGRLKVQIVDGEVTMPLTHEPQDFCRITSSSQSCLNTGDIRVNQQPDLALMTIVFMKEHNRLAEELGKLNPQWTDEQLYQEARRINIAQEQHITFSEYIQHVLAPQYIDGFKLSSLRSGNSEYNPKLRGGTINEFTMSIFRTFHSTVQGDLKLLGQGGNGKCPFKRALLEDYWWTTGDLVVKCFEELAKGLMVQNARLYKNYFTVQQNELYQKGTKKFGDDLSSIDIMRGRDAGTPSYNKYRKLCGLSTFSNFDQLTSTMPHQAVDKLRRLYKDVEDIDLFVGAILEIPVSPGLTGPTVQCVLSQQMARWKHSDRFYYEHNTPTAFTKEQLAEIRKVSFSSLMCQNTRVGRIQKKGFYPVSASNREVPCSQIYSLNLKPWKI